MAIIFLSSGEQVLIDDSDFGLLSQYKWKASPSGKKIYAATSIKKDKWRKVYMHRLIVQPRPSQQVDHVNNNSLDNRRSNLRLCSPEQNAQNRKMNGGIKYKGVRKSGNVYRATISKNYPTEKEAALAYNKLAKVLFGEFAYQNEVNSE